MHVQLPEDGVAVEGTLPESVDLDLRPTAREDRAHGRASGPVRASARQCAPSGML